MQSPKDFFKGYEYVRIYNDNMPALEVAEKIIEYHVLNGY